MITSSPSPSLHPGARSPHRSGTYRTHPHYNGSRRSPLVKPYVSKPSSLSGHASPLFSPTAVPGSSPRASSVAASTFATGATILASTIPAVAVASTQTVQRMVDAATQYSPQRFSLDASFYDSRYGMKQHPPPTEAPKSASLGAQSPMATKRSSTATSLTGTPIQASASHPSSSLTSEGSSPKRSRIEAPPNKLMPIHYETCNVKDLVFLISSMLMELIRFNDQIPLKDGHLTRFHSRAPPGISVHDYLQRLATHATLSPPILLSMVYYIDRLCALYPAFTISSLTVHRFLITSATVASKGLSDSFWTNKTYARVGGVSLRELALLELEFLWRVEWKIVPQPEVLVDYYMSLVQRSEGYEIETPVPNPQNPVPMDVDEPNQAEEGKNKKGKGKN